MERGLFTPEHETYRKTVRDFVARDVEPHLERWDAERCIDRTVWRIAGEHGVIGLAVPEDLGGAGETDYRFRVIVQEELAIAGATALSGNFSLQDDIVVPYFLKLGTGEQQREWLPRLTSGQAIGAIAMTEPGGGSDVRAIQTTAVRDGAEWVINGQKTFITSGTSADVVITAVRTDSDAKALSLFLIDTATPGFTRGRKLAKVGLHAQDTAELFFDDVRVRPANLLGVQGQAFQHLMLGLARERMSVAVGAVAGADAILRETQQYCFQRRAFGAQIGDFQNTRFVLAEMATEMDVTRAYVDKAVLALNDDTLTPVDAAKAKWWASELYKRVVDRCVQLYGGYGYMVEYPVARAFLDSRAPTIYGGTTEIMKEIIGRDIAAAHRSDSTRRAHG